MSEREQRVAEIETRLAVWRGTGSQPVRNALLEVDAPWLLAELRSVSRALETVRSTLKEHWLTSVECLHDEGKDVAHCYCTVWKSEPMPTVGAAVDAWVDHLFGTLKNRPMRSHPEHYVNCQCNTCRYDAFLAEFAAGAVAPAGRTAETTNDRQ